MDIPIPLLDLKTQYAAIRDEVRAAVDRVMDSQQFILGPEVEKLESEIAQYCGCLEAVGVSSGTDALLMALMAIDVGPGDEVITTPYSFFATAGTIARLGARPVFVDIDPLTFNIDATQIASRVTPRTKAIIPVHLFGLMADMGSISEIAERHGLVVIEDAAQAIGAGQNGKRAGSIGHMGCFSFYPTKNLGAFGEAGMVTTNDKRLADRLRLLRSHGARNKYRSELLGGNFRIDAIQAAILRVKLKYLDQWTAGRIANAAMYRDDLASSTNITLPPEVPGSRHIFNQFVILTDHRDPLMEGLKARGIGSDVYYPIPLHLQECFASAGYQVGDFPRAESASQRSLALPIYPELTPEMIHTVARAVLDCSD